MTKHELFNPNLLKNVRELVESARREAYESINLITLQTNGEIGRLIFEEEQRGKERAGYGDYLIINLSKELTKTFGRGFSVSNLKNMRFISVDTSPRKCIAARNAEQTTNWKIIFCFALRPRFCFFIALM